MENALKRIELCENMAAMTQKLSKEIIYINERLFSELSKLRDIVKKYEEGLVKEEAVEQDMWQDTSDLKEVTEENQERVEEGDEAEIEHTFEIQLILAKQLDWSWTQEMLMRSNILQLHETEGRWGSFSHRVSKMYDGDHWDRSYCIQKKKSERENNIWYKNFFYNILSMMESKIGFQNRKWNYPNRKRIWFAHF